MLTVRRLEKHFGEQVALCDVTLDLAPGVVALLGPNGAGKTTLQRCLATALSPDAGEIVWCGQPYTGDLCFLRKQIGYLPQELEFPLHMTPLALLSYVAYLKGVRGRAQIDAVLQAAGLAGLARRRFAALSGGQVRLAGIAQAFLGSPRLLLLDEPARGLDVAERQALYRLIRRSGPERLVVWSTHVPSDVEGLAGQIVVLLAGEVLYAGKTANLCRRAQGQVHQVHVLSEQVRMLPEQYCVSRAEERGPETWLRFVGEVPPGCPAAAVPPTLEEAYLLLLRQSGAPGDA